jgi:outer membrane lipoprotein SlyB
MKENVHTMTSVTEVMIFKKTKRELTIIGIGAVIGGIIGVGIGSSSGDVGMAIFGAVFFGILGSSRLVVLKAFEQCISGGGRFRCTW